MFREVENMQKEVLGEKHADTLNSKQWIAKSLYKEQQFLTLKYCLEKLKKCKKWF